MSDERGKRVRGSARSLVSRESSDEPVGSQAASNEGASRFSEFLVHDTNNVHIGSTNYVKGGPIINININPPVDVAEILYVFSNHLSGVAPDSSNTLYYAASPLSPGSYHQGSSPADQSTEGRLHCTRHNLAFANTRYQSAIASLSEQRESPRNQHRSQNYDNVMALAETIQRHDTRTRHRACSGRREAKSSWGQWLLRVCTQRLRGSKE
ncbi:hypothetical protein F4803DRAFT_518037 [Xylaria telfairii]|nr:hypothetical protein F4803DRAFT_518037 [Xylaria telfairii]